MVKTHEELSTILKVIIREIVEQHINKPEIIILLRKRLPITGYLTKDIMKIDLK